MKALFIILVVLGSFIAKGESLVAIKSNEYSISNSASEIGKFNNSDNFVESMESAEADEELFNDNDDDEFSSFRRKIQLSRAPIDFWNTNVLSSNLNSLRNHPSTCTRFCLPPPDRCILLQVFQI
jgi:hypothetical protein